MTNGFGDGFGATAGASFDLREGLPFVRLWASCPRCGASTPWYRLGASLWHLCPGHGSARSIKERPARGRAS